MEFFIINVTNVLKSKSNIKDKAKEALLFPLKVLFWPVKKTYLSFYKSDASKVRLLLLGIILLAVIAGFFDYPKAYNDSVDWVYGKTDLQLPHFYPKDFKLGLDLLGGTHLVYEADLEDIPYDERTDAMAGVRDVIERRVNSLGVSEPVIQVLGSNRLVAELAGVKDVNEAIMSIGETPLLEFKEQNIEDARELTSEQEQEISDYNKDALLKMEGIIKKLDDGEDFVELVKEYSEDEDTKNYDGEFGWVDPDLLPSVEYAAVSELEKGQYSETMELDKEYAILKIDDTREEKVKVESNHILICYKGAESCDKETTKEEALQKINEIKELATAENFEDLAKEHSTEPGADTNAGYLTFMKKGMLVPEFEEVLFEMEDGAISEVVETAYGYHIIYRKSHQLYPEHFFRKISIKKKNKENFLPPMDPWKNTDLSGANLERSQLTFDQQTGEVQVNLEFDKDGKDLFKEITERNIGKPVAIFLDGMVISAPRVNEVISEGRAVITGNFTIPEGKQLVQRLNAGALPVPINLLSQQTVGATLGQRSIEKSLIAGLIGLLLVCLFMILYYRLPGFLAVIALLMYGVFTLALFKLIGVTLTLSGIAGFILSIGMAVDANVLIFERLKEELRLGKPLASAAEEGFRRAWTSIRDGNLSTLITCVILAWFGTSFIKGFAITLILGVSISMLTAIFITKNLLKFAISTKLRNLKFLYLGFKNNKE